MGLGQRKIRTAPNFISYGPINSWQWGREEKERGNASQYMESWASSCQTTDIYYSETTPREGPTKSLGRMLGEMIPCSPPCTSFTTAQLRHGTSTPSTWGQSHHHPIAGPPQKVTLWLPQDTLPPALSNEHLSNFLGSFCPLDILVVCYI